MHAELERLIRLQEIESRTADAHRRIADAPDRVAALDAKLTAFRGEVAAAKQALADNQAHRRTIEKDLISAQQRLSKSKEQLMEVKTNHEYHAMQSQIAAATTEVSRIEELMLVNMLDGDDVAARLKKAEADLKTNEAVIAAERKAIEADAKDMERVVAESQRERGELVPSLEREHLEMFERVSKARQGTAVARAVDGHCSICHVRLRPQVYYTIRQNQAIIQCDSCQRILYYAGAPQASSGAAEVR